MARLSVGYRLAMADGHSEAVTAAAWWAPALAMFSAIVGGFGLWLANRLMGKAAFQQAINSGFQGLLERLNAERAQMIAEHSAERIQWAGQRAQLEGEIINLTQAVESLKNILRRNGLDIPETHRPAADYQIIPGSKAND